MKRHSLFLFLFLSLVGCATTGVNRWQLNLYSFQDDEHIGKVLSARIRKEMRLANDPVLTSYVNNLGGRLVSFADEPLFRYRFHVVHANDVNAFAIPGGYVYVYTGLLKHLGNEAELAAVLSHEISHVVARHGTEAMSKGQVLSIGAAAVGPEWAQAVQLFGTAGLLHYGRGAELEADNLGIEMMHRANYDTRGFISMMEKLKAISEREPSLIEVLFSTHPSPSSRLEKGNALIESLPHQSAPIHTTEQFQEMKRVVQHY